jgi:hypothetical protein
MKLGTVWVVRDPTPQSTPWDICFEATMTTLANYIRGSLAGDWTRENTAVYTEEGEARKDATARLRALGKASFV